MGRQSKIAFGVLGVLALLGIYGVWDVASYFRDKQAVPCEQMPAADQTRKVFDEHQDAVTAIVAIGKPDGISLEVMTDVCPGKADIGIFFQTEGEKRKIKKLLGGDFFDVPYRLFNI